MRHRHRITAWVPILLASFFGFGQIHCLPAEDVSGLKSSPGSQTRFRFEAVSDKSLGLWEGTQPVLVYNHGLIGNPNASASQSRSAYLHPLYGLDGEVLTD